MGPGVILTVLAGFVLAGAPAAAPASTTEAAAVRYFDEQIAPLLGRHCVECHGPTKRKGRLDLSQRDAAFAGGGGKVILPGNAKESLLWQLVESDEMPEERPPLSHQEKQLLREWIDTGAIWSADARAPLRHLPDRRAGTDSLRRLTVPEYIETVRSAVEIDVAADARRILPPDLRADGFHNTAYNLNVDLAHVQAYASLARIIVRQMDVEAFAARYAGCQELSEDCVRKLVSGMGKWLLRGPLNESETEAFLKLASAIAEAGGDFNEATACVIEAMLQSPRFIYRIDEPRDDRMSQSADNFQLASRLSYILWGAPPDPELMRAADAGELADRGNVEAQVARMLEDPRTIERSLRFAHEWLNLGRLDSLRPNADRFPRWEPQLAADMRAETLAFFKEIAWTRNRPLSELLNAQVTFAAPRLANFYGFRRQYSSAHPPAVSGSQAPSERAGGIQALYTFTEGDGDTVEDVSGAGDPLDLKIEDPSAVECRPGGLTVKAPTLITTIGSATRLIDALKRSKAVTLEAWITPAEMHQSGPARILTLSSGPSQRNFTLGQEGTRFDVRFRATGTDGNGLPSLSTPNRAVETWLTHVVYTRDASGRVKFYINGKDSGSGDVGGDLSNWDGEFRLALGNETTKDRPWLGTFHRVAIYDRALTEQEIQSNSSALSPYDLTSVPARGGLLTHGSLLTVGGDDASMVTRGLFVLQDILWGEVEDPPPCVDTTPVPTKPGLTRRAIAEARLANASCGGCHAKFEPFAFGLERFDGVGAYHDTDEHDNPLRDDGTILFPGSDEPLLYQSSAELMDLLAASERVRKGITRKLTQFALGRPLVESDQVILSGIHDEAWRGGGTYTSLITTIVLSDLVQLPRNPGTNL